MASPSEQDFDTASLGIRLVPSQSIMHSRLGLVLVLGTVLCCSVPRTWAAFEITTATWSNATWEPLGLAPYRIASLCTVGSVVYAGAYGVIARRDLDPARDTGWSLLPCDVATSTGLTVHALIRDPTTTGTLYAGLSNMYQPWAPPPKRDGTYCVKTTDGGDTWAPSASIGSGRYAYTLAAVPGRSGEVLCSSYKQIYKTLDGGLSWKKIYERTGIGDPFVAMAVHPTSSTFVLLGGTVPTGEADVKRSYDGGMTWYGSVSILSLYGILGWCNSFAMDPSDEHVFYAATSYVIYKSASAGRPYNYGFSYPSLRYTYDVAIHPDNRQAIFATGRSADATTTNSAAVSMSNDGAATWSALTAPPGTGYGLCLKVDPTKPNALLVGMSGGGVWRVTWAGGPTFALYADSGGGGSVGKFPDLTYFAPGTNATVTATPNPGFKFIGWDIDGATLASTANPLPIVMNASHTVRARFLAYPVAVTAKAGPGGLVTRQPDLAAYDLGSTVTLTARPGFSYRFSRWQGDVPPGRALENPLVLTVDTTRTLTGQFGLDRSNWIMLR